jgi:hypothetical protein
MAVLSARSVHSMATTDIDDNEDVVAKHTEVDIDAKMQGFFDSYASDAVAAATASGLVGRNIGFLAC